jgi:hypothetical protein
VVVTVVVVVVVVVEVRLVLGGKVDEVVVESGVNASTKKAAWSIVNGGNLSWQTCLVAAL